MDAKKIMDLLEDINPIVLKITFLILQSHQGSV